MDIKPEPQRIEPFLRLLDGLDEPARERFVAAVSDKRQRGGKRTSYAYLRLIALGHAKASPELASVIDEVSVEFGSQVPRAIFRPDVFGSSMVSP